MDGIIISNKLILIQAVLSIVSVFIITYLFRAFIDKKSLNSLGFTFKGADFIIGSLLGIILIFIGFLILWIFGMLEITYNQFAPITLIVGLFGIFCLAFFEEIFIRGYNFGSSNNHVTLFDYLFKYDRAFRQKEGELIISIDTNQNIIIVGLGK